MIGESLESPASTEIASTPASNWQADRALNLIKTTAIALPFGIVGGLAAWLIIGGLLEHSAGLAVGFSLGPTIGFIIGVFAGQRHAWMVYVVAVRRLARRGCVPRDLMHFLYDAHRLGLLRAVGPVYQFRHAELQDHLAATYRPLR